MRFGSNTTLAKNKKGEYGIDLLFLDIVEDGINKDMKPLQLVAGCKESQDSFVRRETLKDSLLPSILKSATTASS